MAPRRGRSSILVRILGDAEGLQKSIGVATGALAGLGAAAGVALTKGFTDALSTQANDDLIAARLGISEADAQRLGDAAASVYRGAWGDSLEGVTDTVTAVFSSFENLDDGELESLTARAEALGAAFELDVGQGVQTASELVSSGLAESADEAFDLLTRGLQEMPQGIRDELLAASNEYGDFFADLGFSGDETFAALTRYAEDGIFGIDKFGDALKELSIRGSDMSAASVEAYEAAGLSADEMATRFLEGGDRAREAVELTAAGLLAIEDPVEQANAAIALFGTPLEDLSASEIPDFLAGITDMGEGLGDVDGAAQRMADQLGSNGRTKLEAFKRKALGGLADFAEKRLIPRFEQFVGFVEDNMPAAIAVFETRVLPTIRRFADQATALFGRVSAWVEQNWPQIQATITAVVERIRTIVTTVLEALVIAWETWGDNILTFVENSVGPTIRVIRGLVEVLEGIIDFVVGTFTGDWGRAWDGLTSIFTGAWDVIAGTVQLTWERIKFTVGVILDGVRLLWDWSFLSDWVSTAVDAVVDFFRRLPGRIRDFVTGVLGAAKEVGAAIIDGIADGISGAFGIAGDIGRTIANAVADLVNTQVIDRINRSLEVSVSLGPLGSVGINPPDIPHLPKFHDGGLIGSLTGPPRDVPIIAQTGEYVVSRDELAEILTGGGGGDTHIHVTNPMPTWRDVEDAMSYGRAVSAL